MGKHCPNCSNSLSWTLSYSCGNCGKSGCEDCFLKGHSKGWLGTKERIIQYRHNKIDYSFCSVECASEWAIHNGYFSSEDSRIDKKIKEICYVKAKKCPECESIICETIGVESYYNVFHCSNCSKQICGNCAFKQIERTDELVIIDIEDRQCVFCGIECTAEFLIEHGHTNTDDHRINRKIKKILDKKDLSEQSTKESSPVHIEIGKVGDEKITVKDSIIQRSSIGGASQKRISICPYCGEELNFPKPPRFCPYCKEQILI